MTTLDAERLITELEGVNKAYPDAFRFRVWSMIMLGYAAIHVLWITSLILLGLMTWFVYESVTSDHFEFLFFAKFFIVGGLGIVGLFLMVFRLLFYQPKLPFGFEVSAKDAPRLFALLEEIRQQTKARPFSHVYLNTELNAGVVYLPTLMGLLPGETNLIIGLPLLAALTLDETKSILAHETGHLLRGHGSFGAWVFRNRVLWIGLGLYLNRIGGLLSGPACAFFRWYVPLLSAYSLVSSREFEYQADQLSAQVAGKEAAARSLLLTHALGIYLKEHFTRELSEKTKTIPKVPDGLCQEMLTLIAHLRQSGELTAFVPEALTPHRDLFQSHPSLANRLGALAVDPLPALATTGESGLSLLEDSWDAILPLGELVMKQSLDQKWSNAHTEHLKDFVVLQRVNKTDHPPEKWNHLQVLEYVQAAHRSGDFEHAWDWVNYYIELQPDEAIGYLIRGQMAMEHRDERCLADFRRAAVLAPKVAPRAYQQIISFAERYAPQVDITADREALHQVEMKLSPEPYRG